MSRGTLTDCELALGGREGCYWALCAAEAKKKGKEISVTVVTGCTIIRQDMPFIQISLKRKKENLTPTYLKKGFVMMLENCDVDF